MCIHTDGWNQCTYFQVILISQLHNKHTTATKCSFICTLTVPFQPEEIALPHILEKSRKDHEPQEHHLISTE